jgi:hypothetical protein
MSWIDDDPNAHGKIHRSDWRFHDHLGEAEIRAVEHLQTKSSSCQDRPFERAPISGWLTSSLTFSPNGCLGSGQLVLLLISGCELLSDNV